VTRDCGQVMPKICLSLFKERVSKFLVEFNWGSDRLFGAGYHNRAFGSACFFLTDRSRSEMEQW
jgi:hypothetical protein